MPPRELGMRSIALIAMTCAAVVASDGRVAAAPFLAGPPEGDGPVVVRTTFELRDINDIDDERETFEFGGVLRLVWHDARQAFDPEAEGVDEKVYQGAYQFDEVFSGWFPQVVLVNESGSYEKLGVVLRVRPDGTLTLLETVNAVAEAELDLLRHPFDRQRLDATFEVLGFDEDEVVLRADPAIDGPPARETWLPQWSLERIGSSTQSRRASYAGHRGVASVFVVSMDVRRRAFFMVRLVAVPLALIVMLSWTVFWMDRASLGDRINVSFIGILTAVAYQIVVSELLPPISYVTLTNAFLNISFMLMCAAVVVNLVVGSLDQHGEIAAGDRIDRRARWLFPLLYFGLVLLATGAVFLLL